MKTFWCFITIFLISVESYPQKAVITTESFDNWATFGSQKISADGMFVSYIIKTRKKDSVLVIQSTIGDFKKVVARGKNAVFSSDSHFAFYQVKDTLYIINLKNNTTNLIENISSFKVGNDGSQTYLAYKLEKKENALTLLNLAYDHSNQIYNSVQDYYFNSKGNALLLKVKPSLETTTCSLLWLDLKKNTIDTIMRNAENTNGFCFDTPGKQLSFISTELVNGQNTGTVYYYSRAIKYAIPKVTYAMIDSNFLVSDDPPSFSEDGQKIYFSLKRKRKNLQGTENNINPDAPVIWKYTDTKLQTEISIEKDIEENRTFKSVLNINNNSIIQLQGEADSRYGIEFSKNGSGEFGLVQSKDNWSETNWRASANPTFSLVSTLNGTRKTIKKDFFTYIMKFSPDGNFLLWFDGTDKNYYSYDIDKQITRNITAKIGEALYDDQDDQPRPPVPFGVAGWLNKESKLLLYDRYDIWEADPKGKDKPKCITRGYGKEHNIVLRISNYNNVSSKWNVFTANDELILTAFDLTNKDNGFYKLILNDQDNVEKLTMGPYIYSYPFQSNNIVPTPPMKASNADVYILQRMSVSEPSNLYVTRDFKRFEKLTDFNWQQNYNWMTSELVKWKTLDGIMAEGILYKPENFDPNNKYPIIFHFYEKGANEINRFIYPIPSDGRLNIAYFVSNGYLVFIPNIYYKKGYPGESAYNSIISAANYLSEKPWVNLKKMGLQGISWGAYQVNYLITRTNMFAAASSSAGFADMVSIYNSLRPGQGVSTQFHIEVSQGRMGATLWQKPELFIDNSPIFKADKITTPLLILHNDKDEAISMSQGIELFTALRRLGKKSWLLQYIGEGHGIYNENNQIDFTIKLREYFDHFLMNKPMPPWMSSDSPAQ